MKLAELCNVSTSFIGEIELGKKFPSANTLQRIADALGLRPFQLFLEEEDWAAFERYKVLTTLSLELKERITEDLNTTIRRYLGGDRTVAHRSAAAKSKAVHKSPKTTTSK